MLDPSRALERGIPTKIAELVTATGTNQVRPFSILGVPSAPNKVHCQPTGAFTALDGNIESSINGGQTWLTYAAFNFATTKVVVFEAAPGVLYRFNVTTITQTTPPDIYATLA